MKSMDLPFAGKVERAMEGLGLTLRGFCREAGLDPSFVSKVLSGKRSPPAEEHVLRRIASVLKLDAAELIVSAGRIPAEWKALWADPQVFRDVHSRATGGAAPRASNWTAPSSPPSHKKAPARELSEELL